MYRTAFPDMHVTIEDLIAEGDKVVVHQTFRATHGGHLQGIPPTGKQVRVSGVLITRIVNGKAEETWAHYDTHGLAQQLGESHLSRQAG
jgi:predicted ester cyclase